MKTGWINNALLALCLQVVIMVLVGGGLLRSAAIYLMDERYLGVFCDSHFDPCGNLISIVISVVYRSFVPGWPIFSAPIVALFILSWIYVCVRRGEFTLQLTAQERRRCIRSTYIVPAIFLFVALPRLPTDFLFSGPIYGFHPLSPLLRAGLSIVTPLVFWRIADSLQQA